MSAGAIIPRPCDRSSQARRHITATIPATAIQRHVARFYNLELAEMLSPARARRISRPRQVAMAMCRDFTPLSLPAIGRRFSRDHSTIIHAIDAVAQRSKASPSMHESICRLYDELERLAQFHQLADENRALCELADWFPPGAGDRHWLPAAPAAGALELEAAP